jgi:carbamoyltransferase
MQFVANVRQPHRFPAISHIDKTARVQTLQRDQHPALYRLLECFYRATGCPILLNTSLNIRGEPLVNTWEDAERFSRLWGVKIF